MMDKFILASNNAHKLVEFKAMLGDRLISQAQAGIAANPEENGSSFEENALIKAQCICELSGLPTIADDSGLEVEALGGAPGIYSARYGNELCENDVQRCEYLLKNMENVEQRRAKFVCVIACVYPDGRKIIARGECEGVIAHGLEGDNGFGYDPLFFLPEYGKTMAQISPELKNEISHRAKALCRLKELIEL